jgi:hypothetical protein
MTEAFLHYVWQFQYFNKLDLRTTRGELITVFNQGLRNSNAGPDFNNGKIRIGPMDWIGTVEIHIHSSNWTDHNHTTDPAYDNVILHVVWKEDKIILRRDGSEIATLELKNRVSDELFLQYRKLVNAPDVIPCSASLSGVSDITKFSMIDRALMSRLQSKANTVLKMLERNNNDWDETAYQLLSRNFGFKVNAEPFETLAKVLPYKVILKHADQPVQVEALLFGQAGFLDEMTGDDYYLLLKREYNLLATKFNLLRSRMNKVQWKFLRLRPANFPSLRMAQWAGLLSTQKNIFSRILEALDHYTLVKIFEMSTSSYWKHHYQFMKPVEEEIPSMGEMSVANMIINTAIPLMVAYGIAKDEQAYIDRGVDILQHVAKEDNVIVKNWSGLGINARSAADSQGLIELHNNFCLKRRCLDCTIGFSIMEPSTT